MNIEERKWFEALKRLLKKKPDSIEILVQEIQMNRDTVISEIHVMPKGVIQKSQREAEDLMEYDPSEHSLASFSINGVAGNNHGY